MPSLRALPLILATSVLLPACADPPNKELHQAQGAIDAARAAGAEQYASEEFEAAVTALDRSHQAVEERDFRLALNHAIDARERAQEAAREAAEQRALARSRAEQAIAAVEAASERAAARLEAAQAARVPARELAPMREQLAAAGTSLQEAREALERQEYLAARSTLEGLEGRITETIEALEKVTPARAPRRRR
jgi:flagellar hook-basal body complex protein FliE